MKLHLPFSLRHALMISLPVLCIPQMAQAYVVTGHTIKQDEILEIKSDESLIIPPSKKALTALASYGVLNNFGLVDLSHINTTSGGYALSGGAITMYEGEVNNGGTMKLSGTSGIYQHAETRLTNSGSIDIILDNDNEDKLPCYGIESRDEEEKEGAEFINEATGTISISNAHHGIWHEHGKVDNKGTLTISAERNGIYGGEENMLTNHGGGSITITSENIGIESHGSITNNQGGTIIINAGYEGIKSDNAVIFNSGNLDITTTKGPTAWTYGINLTSDFAGFSNTQTGVVTIKSARYAIESYGRITNQGRITVDGDINAHSTLDNSGTIELNGCNIMAYGTMTNSGTITGAEGSINLTNGGSLNNSGNMEVSAINGSITNSGTINAGSIGGTFYNTADGIVTAKSITGLLTNDGRINTIGATETGMDLSNDSVNNGEMSIDSQGAGISCSAFTNNGSIDITSGTGDGLEISGYNGGGSFTNTGTITINSANRGIYGETVHNSGTITVNAATCGIDTYYTFTNSGTLNVNITGQEATCGVHVQRNFVNQGELNIDMQGSDSAPGILLTEMMSVYNSGNLHTDSIDAQCAPSSSRDTSINLLHNSVTGALSHDETMVIRAVDNPYLGTSEYISNNAPSLNLGGTRGDDLQVTRAEGGSVVTVDSALSLSGVKVRVLDDVRLKMGGDLTIAKDCSLSYSLMSTGKVDEDGNDTWAYSTLTIDNGDSAHRVTVGESINAKWDGAVAVDYVNDQYTQKIALLSEGGNTMSDVTLSSGEIIIESAEGTRTTLQNVALTTSSQYMTLTNVDISGNSSFTSSGELHMELDDVTFKGTALTIQSNGHSQVCNKSSLHVDKIEVFSSTGIYLMDGTTTGAATSGETLVIHGENAGVVLGGELTDWGYVNAKEEGSVVTVDSNLSIQGGSLTTLGDVRLKMGGDLYIEKNYEDDSLTVDNGNNAHRVTMGSHVDAQWDGAVKLKNDIQALTLISEGGNTMSDGALEARLSITVQSAEGTKMVLENVALSITSYFEAEMTLTNIEVRGNCSFNPYLSPHGSITMTVENVTFVLDGSNSTGLGMEPVSLFSVDPLTQTEVAPNVFYIDSDMLAGVNVAGDLTLDLSYWAEDIQAGGYDSIALSFAEDMLFGEGTEVTATLNGTNFVLADYTEGNMVQFYVANLPTHSVPEPTTATLSLLALSMLAARRRRR